MAQPNASTIGATQPRELSEARARRQALRRKLLAFLAIAGVCLGVVVTRAAWYGRRALARGDAAMAERQPLAAIDHWRRAARWYVPLAPHVEDAYQRLESLARVAESQGDVTTALAAWRGVRHSVLSTRAWYTPHAQHLAPANRRIAALMARIEAERANPTLEPAPEREAFHYQLLQRATLPSVPWVVVALLGFAIWLGGALVFALRAVSADDRLRWRTAARAGALVLGGLILWMTGLFLA